MNTGSDVQTGKRNRNTVLGLLVLSLGMFGFGFALWPLYNIFCEITGVGGRGVQIEQLAPNQAIVSKRTVNVRFDATVNSGLPWEFEPVDGIKSVRLGEITEASYLAFNPADKPITGHATFNVVPPEASLYFVKTECFCFTEQLLGNGETREMPVLFYVKPELPENISEITLSYTFFRDTGNGQRLAGAGTD